MIKLYICVIIYFYGNREYGERDKFLGNYDQVSYSLKLEKVFMLLIVEIGMFGNSFK